MLRTLLIIIATTSLLLVVEWYAFQSIKTMVSERWIRKVWIYFHTLSYIGILMGFLSHNRQDGQTWFSQFVMGFFVILLLPKLFIILPLLIEDLFRFLKFLVNKFSSESNLSYPSRRKFISQLGLGLASIPFAGLIYGVVKGKFNYKVIRYELSFENLPKDFDGFQITHISDIHSGSFNNKEKINYGIDLINQQKSDLILFTGDIVNNKASEMNPWIDSFSKLNANHGKYSVLGNHDYGDYIPWDSQEEKAKNFKEIQEIHSKIGFQLLMDENTPLSINDSILHLVGVENWGKGFHQKGDLEKASAGLSTKDFKILLSHDPSHWEHQVKDHPLNYHLTLSGHTHGFQMGIEIPGWIKWSPVKYVYKYWAGMYKNHHQYLNVNRGFGYHAFPGRIGIWPEISVITLKKA
ncbi:MAG: metallophosphoesterase [Flavobacteriales bacterium]|jgi:predicted MPP superfamily phosphohydrolase|nr:metallophosphoesterase [Flavobacteriales bacterium]